MKVAANISPIITFNGTSSSHLKGGKKGIQMNPSIQTTLVFSDEIIDITSPSNAVIKILVPTKGRKGLFFFMTFVG